MQGALTKSLIAIALVIGLAGESYGQLVVRPSNTLFFRPSAGYANYIGDNNASVTTGGWNVLGELGYQFSPKFSLSGLYEYADYGDVIRPVLTTNFPRVGANTTRSSIQAILRYKFGGETAKFTPYIQAGGSVAIGGDHPLDEPGWGPLFGLGVDYALSPRASLFLELNASGSTPDEATDDIDRDRIGAMDFLNRANFGVQFNLKRRFTPVEIDMINGPTQLQVGEAGMFTATSNVDTATPPVAYTWDFGDGTESPMLDGTHTYAQPGTYTVRFSAENKGSSDTGVHTVVVVPRPNPPEIVTITANPPDPNTQTEVAFTSNVVGDTPLTYAWTFGDGGTATEPNPTHTFTTPGRYTVTLNITNANGTDQQTTQVVVVPTEAAYCSEILELNAAYFPANSSVLSAQARANLQENVNILQDCPNLNVRIAGYAAQGERNPTALSTDRARAVEEFYMQNGILPSRVLSEGLGLVPGQTSAKEGRELYRRADTLPMR
ncbi:MAG: PKD domain-containing protein [Rhodothermales bacterium]|nr:PKD domain-containing protein [Rhodothermales bacterium]